MIVVALINKKSSTRNFTIFCPKVHSGEGEISPSNDPFEINSLVEYLQSQNLTSLEAQNPNILPLADTGDSSENSIGNYAVNSLDSSVPLTRHFPVPLEDLPVLTSRSTFQEVNVVASKVLPTESLVPVTLTSPEIKITQKLDEARKAVYTKTLINYLGENNRLLKNTLFCKAFERSLEIQGSRAREKGTLFLQGEDSFVSALLQSSLQGVVDPQLIHSDWESIEPRLKGSLTALYQGKFTSPAYKSLVDFWFLALSTGYQIHSIYPEDKLGNILEVVKISDPTNEHTLYGLVKCLSNQKEIITSTSLKFLTFEQLKLAYPSVNEAHFLEHTFNFEVLLANSELQPGKLETCTNPHSWFKMRWEKSVPAQVVARSSGNLNPLPTPPKKSGFSFKNSLAKIKKPTTSLSASTKKTKGGVEIPIEEQIQTSLPKKRPSKRPQDEPIFNELAEYNFFDKNSSLEEIRANLEPLYEKLEKKAGTVIAKRIIDGLVEYRAYVFTNFNESQALIENVGDATMELFSSVLSSQETFSLDNVDFTNPENIKVVIDQFSSQKGMKNFLDRIDKLRPEFERLASLGVNLHFHYVKSIEWSQFRQRAINENDQNALTQLSEMEKNYNQIERLAFIVTDKSQIGENGVLLFEPVLGFTFTKSHIIALLRQAGVSINYDEIPETYVWMTYVEHFIATVLEHMQEKTMTQSWIDGMYDDLLISNSSSLGKLLNDIKYYLNGTSTQSLTGPKVKAFKEKVDFFVENETDQNIGLMFTNNSYTKSKKSIPLIGSEDKLIVKRVPLVKNKLETLSYMLHRIAASRKAMDSLRGNCDSTFLVFKEMSTLNLKDPVAMRRPKNLAPNELQKEINLSAAAVTQIQKLKISDENKEHQDCVNIITQLLVEKIEMLNNLFLVASKSDLPSSSF